MNDQRFEHEIRVTLDDAAPPLPPDKLLHTFEQTARHTRRRPRWLAHSTEPAMYYDSRLAVGSPTVRIVSIMAATLMLLLSLAAVGIGAQRLLHDEIVVDASGNGDFTTIREAVHAAKDGTSILVMPGTYSGWFDVTNDISISGVGERSEVVIEYDHEGQVGENWGYGVQLSDVDAAIRNLELRGPSDGTAILARGGSLDLENVLVHPGPFALRTSGGGLLRNVVSYGLVLDGAHDLTVEDSELWCMVRVAATSGVTFERSAFRVDADVCEEEPAPVDYGTRDGIDFRPGDPLAYPQAVQVEAGSPVFSDNAFELPLLIRGGLVSKAATGPRNELWVYSDPPAPGAKPLIEGNTFTRLEMAVTVTDSATAQIRGNDFVGNVSAVWVGRSNAIIEDNTVSGGQSGFVLTSVKPELTGNTVEGVTGPAVSISGAAAPILRDNVLCAEGEVLEIADTANPDIDNSNEICD